MRENKKLLGRLNNRRNRCFITPVVPGKNWWQAAGVPRPPCVGYRSRASPHCKIKRAKLRAITARVRDVRFRNNSGAGAPKFPACFFSYLVEQHAVKACSRYCYFPMLSCVRPQLIKAVTGLAALAPRTYAHLQDPTQRAVSCG